MLKELKSNTLTKIRLSEEPNLECKKISNAEPRITPGMLPAQIPLAANQSIDPDLE